MSLHPREVELRQRRWAQIQAAMSADAAFAEQRADVMRRRREREAEIAVLLDDLRRTRDVEAFRVALDHWARRPGYDSFAGFGQMWVNQIVHRTDDKESLAGLLLDQLAPPQDLDDARAKLAALLAQVETVKEAGQPAPKRTLYVASLFWSMQDPGWPCMWASAEDALVRLGWLSQWGGGSGDLPKCYRAFAEAVGHLGEWHEVEHALFWFHAHSWIGLDITVRDRIAWAKEMNEGWDGDYPADVRPVALANTQAVRADLALLGRALEEPLSDALGRKVTGLVAPLATRPKRYRDNSWVRLQVQGDGWASRPGIQLNVSTSGVVVGLYPGQKGRDWGRIIRPELEPFAVDGKAFYGPGGAAHDADESGWDYLLGRAYPGDEAIGRVELLDEIIGLAAELQPALDKVLGEETDPPLPTNPAPDWLQRRFAEFVSETGYPDARRDQMNAERALMAAVVQPDTIFRQDASAIRRVFSSGHYGSPGPQSVLNTELRDNPDALDRLVKALHHLLWGEGDVADRIDDCLDPNGYGMRGLGESVLMKFLAVAHPETFTLIYPLKGDYGKLRLLDVLEIEPPDPLLSVGHQHVLANNALRTCLEPLLPGDPWGQMEFAYWLKNTPVVVDDPLAAVAEECFLPDATFLEELRSLLQGKRQIVLYGPPGTGKTYIAQRLAKALVGDHERYRLVQFHPSTSYEDFFEGYRPTGATDGGITYALTPGPFAELADSAAQDPGLHILVIDELNRANVPKVFGELLFLLEYRDEEITPLYRPSGFVLPENLWIIATMNTVDRSIASLDAALRRRFHFVPIFPDDGPLEGILKRYLEAHGGDTQWADLVSMVNAELLDALHSSDVLLGPSYFMKQSLDTEAMHRIWRYDIDPLIDDLFYGDRERIQQFRWPEVLKRHLANASQDDLPVAPADEGEQQEDVGSVAAGPIGEGAP